VRNPPIGIAILGFLALMAGFAYLLLGLNWVGAVAFGPVRSGEGVGLSGVLAIIVGVIYLAAGLALWSLQPWAWAFGMILSVFGLFEAVLVAFAADSIAAGFGAALFPAVVLWYLNTNDIKAAFVAAEADRVADAPPPAAPPPAPAPAAPPPVEPPPPPPVAEG
jgi:hypothetical protein